MATISPNSPRTARSRSRRSRRRQEADAYDPRYYATYYAIDAINFEPVKSPGGDGHRSTRAYLPLVIQEAAGLPLDPSFEEQKKIMLRCKGLFYACKEAPRRGASTGC